jgi:ABC-2 type transport system ATP-binding protein
VTAAPSIVLKDASKWYGEVLAVNEVTAEFGPGVTGLLGPNGAGKSTLIKMLTGMLSPSLGTVRVHGADPVTTPGVMRRVGLVPEQDPMYPGVSALEQQVYLNRLHGFPAAEAKRRAKESLERVGLAAAMTRAVAGYSKGMRQRAKLAQALSHEPDVLILDEPMNGLDPVGRREMTSLVQDLGSRGCCVLVSSHVLHEVEQMTHRVLLMDRGRVIAEGTIEAIRRDLSDQPLSVRIGTKDPRAFAQRLVGLDGVRRLELTLGGLEVLTTRPDDLFAELVRLATVERLPLSDFGPTDESLEAVFRYLTT